MRLYLLRELSRLLKLSLTSSERSVMNIIYLSNKEIASELSINKSKVENILQSCFIKLGASNRTHAALIYHGVLK